MDIKQFTLKLPRGWRLSFLFARFWKVVKIQVCFHNIDEVNTIDLVNLSFVC